MSLKSTVRCGVVCISKHNKLELSVVYWTWRVIILILPVFRVSKAQFNTTKIISYSGVSRRMKSKSIAAENAAKAIPPPKAAFGPEFRASTPPATKPEEIELYISFFARYWGVFVGQRDIWKWWMLTDSITHSMPANSAPTLPKPLPLVHMPFPISFMIWLAFCVVFRPTCVC